MPAGFWDVPADAYYSDASHVSHSMREVFRDSVVAYHDRFITKTLVGTTTPDMLFGRVFHCAVLEPLTFEREYRIAPKVDRRTKEGKTAWADFLAANWGKQVIEQETMDLVLAMVRGLRTNRWAKCAVESPGVTERAIRWTCSTTGLPLKCRIDKILANGLVIDLKTTDSLQAFARSAYTYGYHRQVDSYQDGAASVGADRQIAVIAFCKKPPHEVAVFGFDKAALALGHRENEETIVEIAERMKTNNWESRYAGGVRELQLPRYAFKGEDS